MILVILILILVITILILVVTIVVTITVIKDRVQHVGHTRVAPRRHDAAPGPLAVY